MKKDFKDKKIILTEEEAEIAAETILNVWLKENTNNVKEQEINHKEK